ncbi:hypothetical protein D7X98_10685 [bacterium 1XD8-76]|nr:hypothetical protein D7X98_10685 [bacterium 1XD8-76]
MTRLRDTFLITDVSNTRAFCRIVSLKYVDGQIPVFCGIVDSTTERALENAREAEQLGAEYLVATVPFYIHNTCQGEILQRQFRRHDLRC